VSGPGRRQFLLAASALLAAPRAALAQRADRLVHIGFLSPVAQGSRDEAFLDGLRALGWVQGRNIAVAMRFAEGQPDRLPGLVQELLALNPDVLVVGATIGARAAKRATKTVPIVFAGSSDPVAGGIVTNLRRPGGNITGFSLAYGDGFVGKWLELLREAAPDLSHAALLWSSSNAAAKRFVSELRAAAKRLRVQLDVHHASKPEELDAALGGIRAGGARGMIVAPSPFAVSQRRKLVRFAEAQRLPAIYFVDSFAKAGGLMSYGPNIPDVYRRAAAHVDRILKGAKPGDLPVERPTKFDLVVNLSAAKAIGLTVPPSILLRADRVID
jgi:putative ABC transport system substrate-binding protein